MFENDKISQELLSYVASKATGTGMYQIIRRFGLPNAQYDLLKIVDDLTANTLLKTEKDVSGNDIYIITDRGRESIVARCDK